jgi:choline dehydrogenase-like flavoprotein
MADARYDVIIIGSGAGGGTLAHRLAPSGKKILILERGDWLPREAQNWSVDAVFRDNRYVSIDTWYLPNGSPFQPQVHYFVGGATKLFGAALYRLRKEDFGELRHYDGISPAWPISYEDLEPYYVQAEALYQVHGQHGTDPSAPFSSASYPVPPVSSEPRIKTLWADLESAGYHPFAAPAGVMLDETNRAYSPCIRCQTCDGFPCLMHAKCDAETIAVRPSLQHAGVTLLRNAFVSRLRTDASGRTVIGADAVVEGVAKEFQSDVVVISCGAANSAALLLRSANEKHPTGLANGSDQVGRNYMYHNSQAVLALSAMPNETMFQKTLAWNDFYFGSDDFPYPMGNIQMIGKTLPGMYRAEKPLLTALAPEWSLEDLSRHALDFWLTTEDLPDPDNRITIDAMDRITLSYTPNNQVPKRKLYEKLRDALSRIGLPHHHLVPRSIYMESDIELAGCAHQAGTCRFGDDPATSVLDRNCKAHELDNLYVVDTSFFVSIGAVNPSLTAIANALRVGDHLLQRLN